MKQKLFNVAAALSLVVACALFVGYVADARLDIVHVSAPPVPGMMPTDTIREIELSQGRFAIWINPLTKASRPLFGAPGWHVRRPQLRGPRAPSISRSFDFDAHSFAIVGSPQTFLFAFPIWCLLLPSLIAPALWWRQRRRERAMPQGFAVLQPIAAS